MTFNPWFDKCSPGTTDLQRPTQKSWLWSQGKGSNAKSLGLSSCLGEKQDTRLQAPVMEPQQQDQGDGRLLTELLCASWD